MRYIIVAYDKNRLIGGNNELLWQDDMLTDMKRFKDITTGGVVIMGRKTYDSIGRVLPNRQNIVISRQDLNIKNVDVVGDLEKAYKIADNGKDVYVIGGGQIFSQALDSIDQVLATEIDATFDGDVFFTKLTDEWHEISRNNFKADDKNKYDYSFVVYAKRQLAL